MVVVAQLDSVSIAVAGKLEKERPVMAAVGEMEHATLCGQAMGP